MMLAVYNQPSASSLETNNLHKIEPHSLSFQNYSNMPIASAASAASKKSKAKKVGLGFIFGVYMDVQKYVFREHVDAFKAKHSRTLSMLRII